jgi:hypothetical protein
LAFALLKASWVSIVQGVNFINDVEHYNEQRSNDPVQRARAISIQPSLQEIS